MLSRLATYTLLGIEALPVEVEVDISPGALPKTILVGLAEAAVRESIHRIERALVNSGYGRPVSRGVPTAGHFLARFALAPAVV